MADSYNTPINPIFEVTVSNTTVDFTIRIKPETIKLVKTDSIFYSLFKEFPQIFFELIGETNIDINTCEFKAIELKETALRLDGVMLRVPKDSK